MDVGNHVINHSPNLQLDLSDSRRTSEMQKNSGGSLEELGMGKIEIQRKFRI